MEMESKEGCRTERKELWGMSQRVRGCKGEWE